MPGENKMSEKIIVEVKASNESNKVSVKEVTKKTKYSKLFSSELKSFISLTIKWFESFFKVLFYALVVFGCLFQEFGKRQGKKLDNEKDSGEKLI